MKNTSRAYRYPGVQPFRTDQQHLFFGRNSDIESLFELVFTEKVIVLYGKSGYGKSSLLNAGILPRLTNERNRRRYHFLPILVRFFNWSGHSEETPLQKFTTILEDALPAQGDAFFLEHRNMQRTLWWLAMRRMHEGDNPRLVFVFDQFEEFFSYPELMREQFIAEFADVLYNIIPQGQQWTDEQETFMASRLEVKVLFSIRADRFSFLNQLSDRIPGIMRKLYELRGLSREQAQEAIELPALLEANFVSPRFEYTRVAIEHILQRLRGMDANSYTSHSAENTSSSYGIEAFQLQILCQYVEIEVTKGRIPDRNGNGLPDVDVIDLPDLGNIYEAYYRRQLEQMPVEEQIAARMVVEEGLLFVNDQTGEARRLSMDTDALLQRFRQFGVTLATLQRLENAFLLRREVNSLGGVNFEISHDTLIMPVLKARAERLEEAELQLSIEQAEKDRKEAEIRALEAEERARFETERRTEAERLQHEAQTQRAAAEKQRNLAEIRRRNSRRLTIIAIAFALVAIGLGIWSWQSVRLANKRLIQFEEASSQRDLLEFNQLIKNGNELIDGKYYESALWYYLLADSLRQKHFHNSAFQTAAEGLSDKIRQCQTSLQKQ